MQPPNDVKLGHSFGIARRCSLPGFVKRHRVGTFGVLLAAKCAQPARGHADVRGIDVPVHVEERRVAPHELAYVISEPPDGKKVRRAIERHTFIKAEPLMRKHLVGNWTKTRVIRLELATS